MITLYLAKAPRQESHRLLLECAARHTGLSPSCFRRVQSPGQKPRLEGGPELHFSVSHSGSWWACAFGPEELGLDVQEQRSVRFEALARRFFHPDDVRVLEAKNFCSEAFYRVWTAKEADAKFSGKGFAKGFARLPLSDPSLPAKQYPDILPGHTVCISCRTLQEVRAVFPDGLFQDNGGKQI